MPDLITRIGWRASPPVRPQPEGTSGLWPQAAVFSRVFLVFALWLAVAVIYWPSSKALNFYWSGVANDEYTHGYLVLLISLWLVVRGRKRLAAVPLRPAPRGLIFLLLLTAFWVWFWRAAVQDLQLLMLPLILFASLLAVLGSRAARVLGFPVGFLYFAMPVWGDFSGILQVLSDKATGVLIWISGIPAVMQGDLIQLPAGSLEIAEGCSGMHFLVVGLALATLYGELAGDSRRRRLAWLAIMGGLALISNWLRIFAIAVVGYASDMRSPLVANHYWFGWAIFAVAFFIFLWFAGRLAAKWDRDPRVEASSSQGTPARDRDRISLAHAAVTLFCLALLPGLSYGMDLMRQESGSAIAIDWPMAPAGWRGPLPVLWSEWAPAYQHASEQAHNRYVDSDGRAVEIFTVVYLTQRQDAKLLGYWNSLLGSDGRLQAVSEKVVTSPSGAWRQTMTVDPAGNRSLIWSRYRIGARAFVEPRLAQLWYGIAALTSRPVSSLAAFRAVCTPDCAEARSQLAAATKELEPTLRLGVAERGGPAP